MIYFTSYLIQDPTKAWTFSSNIKYTFEVNQSLYCLGFFMKLCIKYWIHFNSLCFNMNLPFFQLSVSRYLPWGAFTCSLCQGLLHLLSALNCHMFPRYTVGWDRGQLVIIIVIKTLQMKSWQAITSLCFVFFCFFV